MPTYRLIRHPSVDRDLSDIARMIADCSGDEVARRKLDAIERTVRRLAQLPHIGSLRDEICPGLRAIPTARKGVVCFVVDDERQVVKIVAIAYAGREWMSRARRREGRPT